MLKKCVLGAVLLVLGAAGARADGDAEKGAAVFKKCTACHAVGEGARNKVGPELNGIVGRKIGSVEGFTYSAKFKEHGAAGDSWTPEMLSEYLTNPRVYMPGTRMVFAGLAKEDDREDLIAYLAQFDASGAKK